jgi:hypothetical protein
MLPRERLRALSVVLFGLAWSTAACLITHPHWLLALLLASAGLLTFVLSCHPAGGYALGRCRHDPGDRTPALALVNSAAMGGLLLVLTGATTTALGQVAWRVHDIDVSSPVWWRDRLPSLPAVSHGVIEVWTGDRLATIRVTFETLGIHFIWYLLATLLLLAALSRAGNWKSKIRDLAAAAGIIVAYACLRFAFGAVLAVELEAPKLVWASTYSVLSWLPMAFFLKCPGPPYAFPLLHNEAPALGQAGCRSNRIRGQLAGGLAALVAGLCLAFAATYNDPGIAKPGRVLIDEGHANWEWTGEPFDTTAFGIRAEYNYHCLKEYLGRYYSIATTEGALTALDDVDVLILKTPTSPYSWEEIDAVAEFVKRGGGLLLIGDHDNLFGMSTYLNTIAGRFGMRFREDDTFDLETTGFSCWRRPRVGFHPAVRGVARFDFLTSCTIESGAALEPVMVGTGLGSEDGDYAHPNFFGNIAFDLRDRLGPFLQAAARRVSEGRVLLFTDSTCFSNFCMFAPGKPELLLGFADYLNRRGQRYPRVRWLGLAAAGALLGIAVRSRWRDAARVSLVALVLLVGYSVGVLLVGQLNAMAYGSIRLAASVPRVLFDTSHSGVSFFDYMNLSSTPMSQHFEEFYLCAQRVGICPTAGSIAGIERDPPDGVVLVNPDQPFTRGEVTSLAAYVNQGGALLVLDSVTNAHSTAGQVLGAFGISADVVPAQVTLAAGGDRILPILDFHTPRSDPGPSRAEPQRAGYLSLPVGSGKVVVGGDAFRYSACAIGTPLARRQPSRACRDIYREIFAIYGEVTP